MSRISLNYLQQNYNIFFNYQNFCEKFLRLYVIFFLFHQKSTICLSFASSSSTLFSSSLLIRSAS